jgi:UDP-N-acetylmuramate dehydrogenase
MDWTGIKGTLVRNPPMSRYTSMRVGGHAEYLLYPADEEDLVKMVEIMKDIGMKYRFLGNGTNIIVTDKGVDGALIRITRIRRSRYKKGQSGVTVEVSGGMPLTGFIRENAAKGLSGLERLFWIPGTIGGAVKMNAGSFGTGISGSLRHMRVLGKDGAIRVVKKDESTFGYRKSPVAASDCVVSASFLLSEKPQAEIGKDMDYVVSQRKERHPMEFPSAGSVFKNVDGEPAWKFIDKAGLKGFRIGGAVVSEKHANFIINTGSATAQDVKLLIDRVKKEVYEKLGVLLTEEVELWGFDE